MAVRGPLIQQRKVVASRVAVRPSARQTRRTADICAPIHSRNPSLGHRTLSCCVLRFILRPLLGSMTGGRTAAALHM